MAGPPLPSAIVAEADQGTASFLHEQLAADGYAPRIARSPQHALALIAQRLPGVILLGDLDSGRESLELLATLRAGGKPPGSIPDDLPIVVITCHAAELDVLRAFEAGADDLLAKPFSYFELRARMRAVLRRVGPGGRATVLRVGDLVIDTAARSVMVHGLPVALCRREYELLTYLASDPLRVFTKTELLSDVWGFRAQGATRTLDSHACRLRRKLTLNGQQYVINVWGVGYCLRRPPPRP